MGKRGKGSVLEQAYERCRIEMAKLTAERVNAVQSAYEGLTAEEISAEVAILVTPEGADFGRGSSKKNPERERNISSQIIPL